MNADQQQFLLNMAHQTDSIDELRWRFPDVNWDAAEMERAAALSTNPLPAKLKPIIKDRVITLPAPIEGQTWTITTGITETYADIERATIPMWHSNIPGSKQS